MVIENFSKSASPRRLSPAVMAYIGHDDPNRGDSKAAIGLSKLVAEILNGRSLYLDHTMIEGHFKNCNQIADQLDAYLNQHGVPDVVIGSEAHQFYLTQKQPKLIVDGINECISRRGYVSNGYIVCHHLTSELLEREADKFRQIYPNIRGPLIAVLMGGWFDMEHAYLPKKLSQILLNYPEYTLFICPSRRTKDCNFNLKMKIEEYMHRPLWERLGLQGSSSKSIMTVDYKNAIKDYNPYLGLLGAADHLVVAGDSSSIISEALYTGKTVYTYEASYVGSKLMREKNRIKDMLSIDDAPFVTQTLESIDITREIAQTIADEYRGIIKRHDMIERGCVFPQKSKKSIIPLYAA